MVCFLNIKEGQVLLSLCIHDTIFIGCLPGSVVSWIECLFRSLNLYYSWRRLLNQKHPMPRETMVFANLANSSYWGQSSLCYIVYTHANQYYGTILPIIIIIPPLFGYCVLASHRLQIMTQTSICPAQCPSSVYNQREKNAIVIFAEILFWGKLCVDYEFGKYRRPIKQSGENEGSPWRSAESETQHLQ